MSNNVIVLEGTIPDPPEHLTALDTRLAAEDAEACGLCDEYDEAAQDDLETLMSLLDRVDVGDYDAADQVRLLVALGSAYHEAERYVRAYLASGLLRAADAT